MSFCFIPRRWLAVPLAALVAAAPAFAQQSGAPQPLDAIVAIVNNDIITRQELSREVAAAERNLRARGATPPPRDALARRALAGAILRLLQLQDAAARGLEVSEEEAARTEELFLARAGVTERQLPEYVERTLNADVETFRRLMREDMLLDLIRARQLYADARVSEDEVDEELRRNRGGREYRLAHLFVAAEDGDDQKRALIDALRARILAGDSFASLAAAHSDAENALDGGALGWRAPATLPDSFVAALENMSPGEVSGVIGSSAGWHLLLLEERRDRAPDAVPMLRVRHILLGGDDARERAETIRGRLRDGEDFAELAAAVSEDVTSKSRGGDLGWQRRGDLPDTLVAAADAAGGRVAVAQTAFGWHILEVLGNETRRPDSDSMRSEARARLRAQKAEAIRENWLARLRQNAYIKILDDSLAGRGGG